MKILLRLFFCLVLFNAIFCRCIYSKDRDILTLLPAPCEFNGWDVEDSARIYAGEELYTLIDGGADVYFEYGFQRVAAMKYRNYLNNTIRLELYEMSDSAAAYGMFTLNSGSGGKKIEIGNEGRLFEYYLIFWKNRYLVFLTGDDTLLETKSCILDIADSIDRRLGPPCGIPALASCLPKTGLQACKYIRGTIGLSTFYSFETKNIFRMKEGVIGIYPSYQLYIFRYSSGSEAKERYIDVLRSFKTNTKFSKHNGQNNRNTMVDNKGNQICFSYLKNLIIIILTKPETNSNPICRDIINFLNDR